ncbi:Serine/threonine-protein kinase NLK [Eufriesea mexicana]|uniref:Serine/threonine-protein kinase NLK n=1 Tax=Eufriesea mexicana TaxID=516756 RepID=A0A310SLE9_9HYME|nr:Serine/threonine-protein kinase NLK [Eufriesea mexicana]
MNLVRNIGSRLKRNKRNPGLTGSSHDTGLVLILLMFGSSRIRLKFEMNLVRNIGSRLKRNKRNPSLTGSSHDTGLVLILLMFDALRLTLLVLGTWNKTRNIRFRYPDPESVMIHYLGCPKVGRASNHTTSRPNDRLKRSTAPDDFLGSRDFAQTGKFRSPTSPRTLKTDEPERGRGFRRRGWPPHGVFDVISDHFGSRLESSCGFGISRFQVASGRADGNTLRGRSIGASARSSASLAAILDRDSEDSVDCGVSAILDSLLTEEMGNCMKISRACFIDGSSQRGFDAISETILERKLGNSVAFGGPGVEGGSTAVGRRLRPIHRSESRTRKGTTTFEKGHRTRAAKHNGMARVRMMVAIISFLKSQEANHRYHGVKIQFAPFTTTPFILQEQEELFLANPHPHLGSQKLGTTMRTGHSRFFHGEWKAEKSIFARQYDPHSSGLSDSTWDSANRGPVPTAVTDPRDGRRVALKKLPNVFQSLVSSKRVFRELKMLCFFKHENAPNNPARTHGNLCFSGPLGPGHPSATAPGLLPRNVSFSIHLGNAVQTESLDKGVQSINTVSFVRVLPSWQYHIYFQTYCSHRNKPARYPRSKSHPLDPDEDSTLFSPPHAYFSARSQALSLLRDYGGEEGKEECGTKPSQEVWNAQYLLIADSRRLVLKSITSHENDAKCQIVLMTFAPNPSIDSKPVDLCCDDKFRVTTNFIRSNELLRHSMPPKEKDDELSQETLEFGTVVDGGRARKVASLLGTKLS